MVRIAQLVLVASASLAAAPAAAGVYDTAPSFDVLDGVTVDPARGTLLLYGHADGRGPVRDVPYLDYLAAALESQNPTFSLEWTPASRAELDRAFNMPDMDLTDALAHVIENGHLTARGAWWFRMLGADVQEGMDKWSLWTAVLPAAGYPDAPKMMKEVDRLFRALVAGTAGQKMSFDDVPVAETVMEHFMGYASGLGANSLGSEKPDTQTFLNTLATYSNGAEQTKEAWTAARETVWRWMLRGIAVAYRENPTRYVDFLSTQEAAGEDWGLAVNKALAMSQDDTVQVQKDAFHALVASKDFIHVPPDVMRGALGVSPIVVPVFDGLPRTSMLAKTAFEADVLGKNLMDMPEVKAAIPAYRTYFEWRQTLAQAPATDGHTWFAADGFELHEASDGNAAWFTHTPVRIHMEKYVMGAGSTRRPVEEPLLTQYANELTSLYEPLAGQFPVLRDLRESMKVVAIADWLKKRGFRIALPAQGRRSWEPPESYPGVIHMEIAVKPARVGEVMSASGGVDLRVDSSWSVIRDAILAQPGPPPAHGVIIGYNPSSGAVTQSMDLSAFRSQAAPAQAAWTQSTAALPTVTPDAPTPLPQRFAGLDQRPPPPSPQVPPGCHLSAQSAPPPGPAPKAEWDARLDRARAEVKGLEDALKRIAVTQKETEAERAAWQKELDEASVRAQERVREIRKDMIKDALFAVAGEGIKRAGEATQREIEKTNDLIISSGVSDRGADAAASVMKKRELQATLKKLEDVKKSYRRAEVEKDVLEKELDAKETIEAKKPLRDKVLDFASMAVELVDHEAGDTLKWGKWAVEGLYDVSAQVTAIHQMNGALAQNAAQYKGDVEKLSRCLAVAVSRVQTLKSERTAAIERELK